MPVMDDLQATPAVKMKDAPFVRFETKTVQDMAESKKQEKVVFIDRHFAVLTPPGSKDTQYEQLPQWWDKLDYEMKSGRVLFEWVRKWRSDFEMYLKGMEIPVDGTPIRGWKLLSGAQQDNLIRLNIMTVESLANINHEAAANIGMGAQELKRRAEAWLAQSDKESGALQILALKQKNDELSATVATLTDKIDQMVKAAEGKKGKG